MRISYISISNDSLSVMRLEIMLVLKATITLFEPMISAVGLAHGTSFPTSLSLDAHSVLAQQPSVASDWTLPQGRLRHQWLS